MTDKPSGLKEHVRGAWLWVKVVLLVVLITLLVVLLAQNFVGENASATVKFIAPEWHTSVGMVVLVSFLSGVVVTLLVVFLRRGFGK